MPTYVCQVDVNEREYQNQQELVSVWGDIKEDVHSLGGEVTDTYAILGDYDFHLVFTVEDETQAFQVTQIIERHGLDTKTHQALHLHELGEHIADV